MGKKRVSIYPGAILFFLCGRSFGGYKVSCDLFNCVSGNGRLFCACMRVCVYACFSLA